MEFTSSEVEPVRKEEGLSYGAVPLFFRLSFCDEPQW
uniref:Uncharacterized protein n=1 Tax=Anguilla anguilla TaxID=7936 RepID=A0A0E9R2H8_ANGAN